MIEVEEEAAHVLVVDFAAAVRLFLRNNLRREDHRLAVWNGILGMGHGRIQNGILGMGRG